MYSVRNIVCSKFKQLGCLFFRYSYKFGTEKICRAPIGKNSAIVVDYIYEPNEEAILADLLKRYMAVEVYRAFLESSASEHGARMTAMDSATRNAGEMIEGLTLTYNKARQAYITKELIEIVNGAEALKG